MKKFILVSVSILAALSFTMAGCDSDDSACEQAAKHYIALATAEDNLGDDTVADVINVCENGDGQDMSAWTDAEIACVKAAATTDIARACLGVN